MIVTKIKRCLFLLTLMMCISISAHARRSTLDIVHFVIKNSITDEQAKSINGGREICLSNNRPSYECSSYTTISQGICLASNRPSFECSSYISLAQAICLSGGRPSYECSSYIELNQAICLSTGRVSFECGSYISIINALCLARGAESYECPSSMTASELARIPITDVSWAWDQFRDQHGQEKWVCRGRSTGQFAEVKNCTTESKNDEIWPGSNLY